jgi:phosphatidylinositol 4-kinase A
MAGYSVVSYLLQIKDRHNGNILVDEDGHVVHVGPPRRPTSLTFPSDFGFIFDISPGGDIRFERAPFKLSAEMVECMGGSFDAEAFQTFTDLMVRGYLAIRSHPSRCRR